MSLLYNNSFNDDEAITVDPILPTNAFSLSCRLPRTTANQHPTSLDPRRRDHSFAAADATCSQWQQCILEMKSHLPTPVYVAM